MTLFLLFATAAFGIYLIKTKGLEAWRQIKMQHAPGMPPVSEFMRRGLVLFCGVLLIIPGFITDIVAMILLMASQSRFFVDRFLTKNSYGKKSHSAGPDTFTEDRSGTAREGRTIEGEFRRVDKE